MLKTIIVALAMAGILIATTADAAVMVPPWRGEPGTTHQVWEFNEPANPAAPDVVSNVNGEPMAFITGQFPGTYWKPTDAGHQGVWKIDDSIELQIPNFEPANPFKEIWLKIIYDGGPASLPEIFSLPTASTIELMGSISLDDMYNLDTYRIIIEPNPLFESIFVMPRYCEIYIDRIEIDTICIPEPATMSLLALGSVLLARRRRR